MDKRGHMLLDLEGRPGLSCGKCGAWGQPADLRGPFVDEYRPWHKYIGCSRCEFAGPVPALGELPEILKNMEVEKMPDEIVAEEGQQWTPTFVPVDVYSAKVVDIRDVQFTDKDGKVQDTWSFVFELSAANPAVNGLKIEGLARLYLSPTSKLWKWATVLGAKLEIGKSIRKVDLIGHTCRVLPETKTRVGRDGKSMEFSSVKEVLPA